jgi:hypothetical protein
MEQNPDIFGLIFETWCTARRSKPIKEEFNAGISQRPADIKKVIETAAKKGVIGVRDPVELEGLARILLALYHGIALQLIHTSDIGNNQTMLNRLKKISSQGLHRGLD